MLYQLSILIMELNGFKYLCLITIMVVGLKMMIVQKVNLIYILRILRLLNI